MAALATVAIPGFRATGVRPSQLVAAMCDVTDVCDARGELWTIRAPRSQAASVRLSREISVWAALHDTGFVGSAVPVPRAVPFTETDHNWQCVMHPRPEAHPLDVATLDPHSALLERICTVLARLHRLPIEAFSHLDIPHFTADDYRQTRLAEVTRAIDSGAVPPALASRWVELLQPGQLWDFDPVVVHGDLVSDHVLVHDGELRMIAGWSETKIADPADDLAWLLAGASSDVATAALDAYELSRRQVDNHLLHRSRLAGELSVVRWLLHGSATDNLDIMKSARGMLQDLDHDIAAEAGH